MASPPTPAARKIPFLAIVTVIAVLYVGRDFFLPMALAVLISFLLAPIIRRLERRLGRVASVIFASMLAFSAIGTVGYTIAGQLIDLANALPTYKSNLHAKIVALKTPNDGPWNRATNTLRELSAELTKPDAPSTAPNAPPSKVPEKPVPVEVIYTPGSALESLRTFVAPVAAPLGTAAVVIVLVIFMLLGRKDLRDRMIHLIGHGQLHVTTQALDEAGERVSRYLAAQCIINLSYGIPIGLGLWLIGVPNAVLWGLLAAILRFLPYIGPWIGAAFPVALSLAVSPSWSTPLLTLALFVGVELISANVVEPWLYGASTGLSAMAIIVSAIFWAWLWGPIGLVVATPLTVCIAVVGKYIPALSFLGILLGDKPPIAVSDRFYQRLLALDGEEVLALCEDYTAAHSLAETFDDVIVPALHLVDTECRGGNLDDGLRKEMHRIVREVITELGGQDRPKKADAVAVTAITSNAAVIFLCLPASNESDELASLMLAELLAGTDLRTEFVTSKALVGEMIETAMELRPKLLCISSVSPASVIPAQHLCRRLRERLGKGTRIMVGLWNETPAEHSRRLDRFKRADADEVFLTLGSAANEILLQARCAPHR